MKKGYEPQTLPPTLTSTELIQILKKETEARVEIERFNTVLERSIVRKDLLMLFSIDESIQSTKIEGTQATFNDVMETEVSGKASDDTIEVLNYHKALYKGATLLDEMPISTRLFHELHKIMLSDARGKNRRPGEYRRSEVFIGPDNKKEHATYIPPSAEKINQLMSNLEKYINEEYEDDFGVLSRCAVIHGQFETIHPYLDGNGRIGRILIILYLINAGVIKNTTFFISQELERNKFKYYSLLNGIREDVPKWKEWILFFLDSAKKQAQFYMDKLVRVEELYSELINFTKSKNIKTDIVDAIFSKPYFKVRDIEKKIGVSYNTARRYVNIMLNSGRIFADDKVKNKVYRFYDLIDIMR